MKFIVTMQVSSFGRMSTDVAWNADYVDEVEARADIKRMSSDLSFGETIKNVSLHNDECEVCCYETKIKDGVAKTREIVRNRRLTKKISKTK